MQIPGGAARRERSRGGGEGLIVPCSDYPQMGLRHRMLAVCFRESQAFALQWQKAPGDKGEESASGDHSGGRGGGGLSESKIKEWKKNLAQYDVSVNTVSVPRREDR